MLAIQTSEHTCKFTLKFYFPVCLLLCLWLSPVNSAMAREAVYVCNKGDIEVLYASLGTRVNLLFANASIEGLHPIPPGECRDVMPLGMKNVTVAFFHFDKAGQLGNVVYSSENAKRDVLKKAGSDRMCVERGKFQYDTSKRRQTYSQFVQSWSPPCPPGRVPAENSFGIWGGTNFEYTINITPSLEDLVIPLAEDNRSRSHNDPVKPLTEENKARTQDDESKIQIKTFDDGAQYEGQMKDSVPHGRGVMKWPDGGHYDGEWRSGKRHGQGTMRWPDGRQFSGSWGHNGPNSRSGTWTLRDGRTFNGRLVNDIPDGPGTMTWPDGRKLQGHWKNGKTEGTERWKWPDGRTFRGRSNYPTVGQWGTLTWPNGEKFYGPLKDFKPNGKGKMTLPDGSRFDSIWENGVLIKKLDGR